MYVHICLLIASNKLKIGIHITLLWLFFLKNHELLHNKGTGFNFRCLLLGSDAVGTLAIGLLRWKNLYTYGNPHHPLTFSEDVCSPVFQHLPTQNDLSYPLSCPASLSITPVPSYSSSSQETLSQDCTGKQLFLSYTSEPSLISSFSAQVK